MRSSRIKTQQITLKEAVNLVGGPAAAASAVGKTPRAIYKWLAKGVLPRTDYTGETNYADQLAEAAGGVFTGTQLRESLKQDQAA